MNDLNQFSLLPWVLLISIRTVLCIGLGFALFSMTTWNLFLTSPKENSIFQTWTRGRGCESRKNRSSCRPSLTLWVSCQSKVQSTGEHKQCPSPPPRSSHRNCAVLFSCLMCFIHSMCISLLPLQLREPKPQEQNNKPRVHLANECHLPRKKKPCVYNHREMCLTIHYMGHIWELRNVSDVPSQPCPFQCLHRQPNESDVIKISPLALWFTEIDYYKYSHQEYNQGN